MPLTSLPSGKSALRCKWAYKIKHRSDVSIRRYKARLVTKCYSQREDFDYLEKFSPMAEMTTIHCLLSVAAVQGWFLLRTKINNAN